jgi:radical SAM enzyme (TIGR01210 family)
VLNRVTISNEGSVLDFETFPKEALLEIARCLPELRLVRRCVLETRLEFLETRFLQEFCSAASTVTVDILTGFETYSPNIRDQILVKKEPLDVFLAGLDRVAKSHAHLTAYVLFKPSPRMSDQDAVEEIELSINFLAKECQLRRIPLTIRVNPMYAAKGSSWARLAANTPNYQPPRLTDLMSVAENKVAEGLQVYIGLSTEGLDDNGGTYHSREDYSSHLIRPIMLFNDKKIASFKGTI